MRTKILAALVLLSLMLGCADEARTSDEVSRPNAAASEAIAGMPALAVSEAEFNFGEVSEGKEYVHDFVIMNGGTGVLEIKKVTPGCGTSIAGFDRSIPPGSEGKISIRLYPRGCVSGSRKVTEVFCNDPQYPRFTLVVQGKSKPTGTEP